MEWLGRANISFTSSTTPLKLKKKDGTVTDLLRVAEASTPQCWLNPFLFNGHLQTIWTAVKDDGPPIYYKRKHFEAEDSAYAGSFAVDFVVGAYAETDASLPPRTTYYNEDELKNIGSLDSRPMLVLLHGLSGGSYEVYLRQVLVPLVGESGGWEACVVNSRGCAEHKITSSILYNARSTWDARQTIKWLRKTFPNRPLFGAGFSLGANILMNYIGEEGDECVLKAAVLLSNPWNLDIGNKTLQRTWLGREIYSKTMGQNLKKLFNAHKEQLAKNPDLDLITIEKVKYLHEFDRAVQCPTWGYPTEGAYYRDASSVDGLLAARIPVLAVSSTDDPIAMEIGIPYEEFKHNPYTVLCTTSLGGHLSWFEWGGQRWHAKPAANFLNNMAFNVVLDETSPANSEAIAEARAVEATYSPMRRKLHR